VVFPEGVSVTHGDQSDARLLHVRVEMAFDVDRHGTGALVQDGVHRLVVDQSAHSHALLFSA